jgi:hypothetical protein
LRHDGNPAIRCTGKADRRGNLYPTKSRPDQKIDAAVALMMAIDRAMVEDDNQAGLNRFLADPIAFDASGVVSGSQTTRGKSRAGVGEAPINSTFACNEIRLFQPLNAYWTSHRLIGTIDRSSNAASSVVESGAEVQPVEGDENVQRCC